MLYIDFQQIRFWDVLDLVIVMYLFYIIYQLLKGNIAFNIFIGGIAVFGIWKLTHSANMRLTSSLFEQIASVGIIMLIIVFQPEIRRFLLVLGKTTLRQRYHFFDRWFDAEEKDSTKQQQDVRKIKRSIVNLSKEKVGAIIVISNDNLMDTIGDTGIILDAQISSQLIESIFTKKSPLHDGAIIIIDGKIKSASCVLPLSHNSELPKNIGLRHRAAIGTTEQNNVVVVVVSEETGEISFSKNGELNQNISENELSELLLENYK